LETRECCCDALPNTAANTGLAVRLTHGDLVCWDCAEALGWQRDRTKACCCSKDSVENDGSVFSARFLEFQDGLSGGARLAHKQNTHASPTSRQDSKTAQITRSEPCSFSLALLPCSQACKNNSGNIIRRISNTAVKERYQTPSTERAQERRRQRRQQQRNSGSSRRALSQLRAACTLFGTMVKLVRYASVRDGW